MTLKEVLERPIEGVETALTVIDAVDGKGKKLEISQRRLLPEAPRPPIRAESPARGHVFFEVSGFIAYLRKYGIERTVIFADPQAARVQATIDEEAKNGRETIEFRPMLHPQWKPWNDLLEQNTLPLADFLEHCANNRRGIVQPDARDLVLMFSQVNASSKVEVAQGQGKNSINGVMVTTTIKGADDVKFGELPDTIVLDIPIFVGTQPTRVEIDLTLGAKPGEGVFITLAAGDLLEAKYRIFQSMCLQFDELVKEKKCVYTLGAVFSTPWAYLPEPKLEPAVLEKSGVSPAR